MSELIFKKLCDESPIVNEKAKEYLLSIPTLNKVEKWRWTDLSALRKEERKVQFASYQVDYDERVEESYGQYDFEHILNHNEVAFAALNLSLVNDTLIFKVKANDKIKEPIAINIDAVSRVLQFSQIAIELEDNAEANFWIDIRSEKKAMQHVIIQTVLGKNTKLNGVIWINAESNATSAGGLVDFFSEQNANSYLSLFAVQRGCDLSRLDVNADLKGENASFNFGGITNLTDQKTSDFHIKVNHLNENTTSTQVIRGVLNDEAYSVFDGTIFVAPNAQKISAQQNSRYILLSKEAEALSMPRLEIYADDVQCNHGSTVGYLDKEALFYLQSRGIDKQTAQHLLLLSFLQEAVILDEEELAKNVLESIKNVWTEAENEAN